MGGSEEERSSIPSSFIAHPHRQSLTAVLYDYITHEGDMAAAGPGESHRIPETGRSLHPLPMFKASVIE